MNEKKLKMLARQLNEATGLPFWHAERDKNGTPFLQLEIEPGDYNDEKNMLYKIGQSLCVYEFRKGEDAENDMALRIKAGTVEKLEQAVAHLTAAPQRHVLQQVMYNFLMEISASEILGTLMYEAGLLSDTAIPSSIMKLFNNSQQKTMEDIMPDLHEDKEEFLFNRLPVLQFQTAKEKTIELNLHCEI